MDGDGGVTGGKLVIVVTPTYNRAAQSFYLTRLAHTLQLVEPPLLWIVVEMGETVTTETALLLRKSGVMYRLVKLEFSSTQLNYNSYVSIVSLELLSERA